MTRRARINAGAVSLEMEVAGETVTVGPGDEVFIPKGARHSVRNIHDGTSVWLYGYD